VFGATTVVTAPAAAPTGRLHGRRSGSGGGSGYSVAVNTAEGHGGSASIAVPDYWWYVARADLLEVTLRSHVEGAGLALDLGSADGPSAAWFRESAQRTVSLDIDPRGLGSEGVCGSALALPFEDAAFDAVSAFDVIEHCEPEATALAEVRRVLRPGGRFVMSVPAYTWAWTDFDVANGHHRRYTKGRAVAAVERAGFTVQRATYGFATVFPMFAAERLARKVSRRRADGPLDIVSLPQLPAPLNRMLLGLSRVDRAVLARRDLPFGSSVFLAATRAG
jgi:SAM-dependent methyltransferase